MSTPRLGYLCLAENPSAEAGRALVRQFVLVREADRMGFDDIWLGEQHLDSHWPTSGVLSLLGHLAAVTSKARIGSLAMLPALHHAQALAEELATLDLLSKGRLDWGVASGAAFPDLLAAHGLSPEQARARMLQQVDSTLATLAASPAGTAATAPPSLAAPWMPPGQQRPLPVYLAADDPTSLHHAAQRGWGLVAAASHSLARTQAACARYAATAGRPPALTLARFACSADSREQALAIATPYFQALAQRAARAGWGADPARSIVQNVPALIAQSLVGSHAEVAAMVQALGTQQGVARLAIVPTSGQFDTHKHILAAFVDEVRPLLDD